MTPRWKARSPLLRRERRGRGDTARTGVPRPRARGRLLDRGRPVIAVERARARRCSLRCYHRCSHSETLPAPETARKAIGAGIPFAGSEDGGGGNRVSLTRRARQSLPPAPVRASPSLGGWPAADPAPTPTHSAAPRTRFSAVRETDPFCTVIDHERRRSRSCALQAGDVGIGCAQAYGKGKVEQGAGNLGADGWWKAGETGAASRARPVIPSPPAGRRARCRGGS